MQSGEFERVNVKKNIFGALLSFQDGQDGPTKRLPQCGWVGRIYSMCLVPSTALLVPPKGPRVDNGEDDAEWSV